MSQNVMSYPYFIIRYEGFSATKIDVKAHSCAISEDFINEK